MVTYFPIRYIFHDDNDFPIIPATKHQKAKVMKFYWRNIDFKIRDIQAYDVQKRAINLDNHNIILMY